MNGIPLFPPQASAMAREVDHLFYFEMAVSLFFVLLFIVLIVYFAARYRRVSDDEFPPALPSDRRLEAAWIAIPFGLLLVMFYWGGRVYVRAKRPLADPMVINVIGKQWMWKFQHPDGAREINGLHVPLGRPIKLVLASQDVIHDLALPAFRIRQDVVPGSYVTEWFTPTQLGEYRFYCDQFCGMGHSEMVGQVIVLNTSDYQAWLAGVAPSESPAASGQRLFNSWGCAACHGQRAPTMAGLYMSQVLLSDGRVVVADDDYLRESIVEPAAKIVAGYPNIMPSYRKQLTEEQIFDLLAYIKTMQSVANPPPNGIQSGAVTPMPAPSTQPSNGYSPRQAPNYPPARRPPDFDAAPNLKTP